MLLGPLFKTFPSCFVSDYSSSVVNILIQMKFNLHQLLPLSGVTPLPPMDQHEQRFLLLEEEIINHLPPMQIQSLTVSRLDLTLDQPQPCRQTHNCCAFYSPA